MIQQQEYVNPTNQQQQIILHGQRIVLNPGQRLQVTQQQPTQTVQQQVIQQISQVNYLLLTKKSSIGLYMSFDESET